MNITNEIVAELQASGCVAHAQAAAVRSAAATVAGRALGAVIAPVVGSRVYQLQQPKKPVYPNAVFQPVGFERVGPDGLPMIRIDTFELHIRAEEIGALVSATDEICTALLSDQTGSAVAGFDINDRALDLEYEEDLRRALLSVQAFSVAADVQQLPAAFVYPAANGASESHTAHVVQESERHYHVAVVAKGEVIESVERGVSDALLGFIPTAGQHITGLTLVGGDLLQHYGPLALWRNTYALTEHIQSTR